MNSWDSAVHFKLNKLHYFTVGISVVLSFRDYVGVTYMFRFFISITFSFLPFSHL